MKKMLYKKIFSVSAILFASSFLFAEKAPVYISPNNDGVQDALVVPVKIKETRYIDSWSFIITDESGKEVRVIGNKEKRPDKITFKSFFKSLASPKTGVEIPSEFVWNGVMDDGSIAPDGTYFYQITASDDNGNTGYSAKYKVIVDNTPPEIVLKQPSQADKIFGEGSKSTLKITQSGSVEDLWIAPIADSTGKIVRTFKWSSSEPLSINWDGTDDDGNAVADGIYTYKITATDRAGNKSENAQITNIIYSAEKPATNIALTTSRYFSPNGDGVKDYMVFSTVIPKPESKNNSLVSWDVKIVEVKTNKVVRTFSGSDDAPSSIVFDGKTDSGTIISEGEYQAQLSAKYLNGYEPAVINSPVFVMDITVPSVMVRLNSDTLSPDGDGNKDKLLISQQGSKEKLWTGRIKGENGLAVKTFEFNDSLPSQIEWDGVDSNGKLCSDGTYVYEIESTDLAGNTTKVTSDFFELDTSKTELMLSCSVNAFSPNNDKVQDKITFTPFVKTSSGVDSWILTITTENLKPVKVISEKRALPESITWDGLKDDGTRCADGKYIATLSTKAKNGNEASVSTSPFVLDTQAPQVSISVPYTTFSPDKDGRLDVLPFTADSSQEEKWTGEIRNAKGQLVRTYTWQGKVPSFSWDGTDENGNIAANGNYSLTVSSIDAAGNKGSASLNPLTLDNRETKAYITTELEGISPNGDGKFESQKFNVKMTLTEGISAWSFEIVDQNGNTVRKWTQKDSANLPSTFIWDGAKEDGNAAEGTFTGKLHAEYAKGNIVDAVSSPFICTATAPQLRVRTAPEYFSPDNDGVNDDLFIQLKGTSIAPLKNWSFTVKDPNNGKPFWKTSGKSSITERLIWDGRGNNGELVQSATDYPYVFEVTDTLGMTSSFEGVINVDVLVIRVGDVLKMQVPSIIFRKDAADFKVDSSLTKANVENNERVLKRIAQILNKFKDYTVTIEGHANNVSGTEAEETSTANGNIPLEPLSQKRADFVKEKLVQYGVDANRLTSVGRGGRQPVVARSDRDNWWKNRRVEFILNK